KLFPVFSSQLLAVSVESLNENPKGSCVSICICLMILPSYMDTSCFAFWVDWLLRFWVVDLKMSLCRNLVAFLFFEYDSIFLYIDESFFSSFTCAKQEPKNPRTKNKKRAIFNFMDVLKPAKDGRC